jgi:hypothetical protein
MRAFFAVVAAATLGFSIPVHAQTSVTTGGYGPSAFLLDVRQVPFVSEIIPVVGSPPLVFESPLKQKLRMAGGVSGLRPPLRRPEPGEDLSSGRPFYEAEEEVAKPAAPRAEGKTAGSSAERGDLSVAAIRRELAAEDAALQAELDRLVAQANRLEAAGNRREAAHTYSKAAAKVDDQRREAFLAKARQLRAK